MADNQNAGGGTAVATREKPSLPADIQANIDAAKMRRQIATQIRGQMWGKDLGEATTAAIARYCIENQIDPVRHVEVLGGRIYLTAEFYDERGAHLLRDGTVIAAEPDYINADDRLTKLAADGDSWAKEELQRRVRLRIQYNVPEEARAAVVQKMTVAGTTVVGVNWCGGLKGGKRDPVGDAEPAKTAQTRARRRVWKQIADVLPGYGELVKPVEASAKTAIPVAIVEAPEPPAQRGIKNTDEPYGSIGAGPVQRLESDADILADDRELARAEGADREAVDEG